MKSITLKNISKTFQGNLLFDGVTFSVQKGDRIAVIGKNGAGKSTLLKIIADTESCDSGSVIAENSARAYVPQEFGGEINISIMEYLDIQKATAQVFSIIKQFDVISEAQLECGYVYELSGGQKRVLEIAAVLSTGPMFLCIDEPENHLDIKTRAIMTDILKQYWGAVVFVSHDQYVINGVSNKIVSIQNQHAVLMSNKSYEEFKRVEAQHMMSATARWKSETRALDKLEETVRMLKARTRYNDSQARTYQMKKRELEERRASLGSRPDRKSEVKIGLDQVRRKTGKLIFSCDDVKVAYAGNSPLLEHVTVELRFGEKVVLLGRNGAGKTTFLQLLQSKIAPQAGEVRVGNDIAMQYIDQSSTLDTEQSPLEHFSLYGFTEERARSLMAQFLFTQIETESALKTLSGGQQQRFTFLFLFTVSPECLILDEPTNNLDPETWELLLRLINEYTGSLLIVSHDRSFVERIERKRLWVLQNKTITESWADLDEVLQGL